jgi:hypothetical protein
MPSPPAAPGIAKEDCEAGEDLRCLPTTMVGGKDTRHPFHGVILCSRCRRKVNRRELAVLQDWRSHGRLNEKQEKRLAVLEDRVVGHRNRDKDAREKCKLENGGILSPSKKARSMYNDRNRQSRDSEKFASNPCMYQAKMKRQTGYDAVQKAKCKTKKTGITRHSDRKQLYPPEFQSLLEHAALTFVQMRGEALVYYNNLTKLFDQLLARESQKAGGLMEGKVVMHSSGSPRYIMPIKRPWHHSWCKTKFKRQSSKEKVARQELR